MSVVWYVCLCVAVVPPRVSVDPPSQTLRPGDLFRVDCEAFDPLTNQQVRVEWSRDPPGGPDLSLSALIDNERGSLEIVSVTAPDAGLYRCTAFNEAGPNSAVFELVIFGHCCVLMLSFLVHNCTLGCQFWQNVWRVTYVQSPAYNPNSNPS